MPTPGVFYNEYQSANTAQLPSSTAVAMVGGAKWGPNNDPQLVNTVEELVRKFGAPSTSDPGLLAAVAYLQTGRNLYYSRVVDGNEAKAQLTLSGIDITTAGVQATFTLTADADPGTAPTDADTVQLQDAEGNTLTFEFDDDASVTGSNVSVAIGADARASLLNLSNAIDAQAALGNINMDSVHSPNSGGNAFITLTQTTAGTAGNTAVTTSLTPVYTESGGGNFAGGIDQVSSAVSNAVVLEARYDGTKGDDIQAEIVRPSQTAGAAATSFDLIIYAPPVNGGTAEQVEKFVNLNLTSGDTRYINTVLAEGIGNEYAPSEYVRVNANNGTPDTLDDQGPTNLGDGADQDGADGFSALLASDYVGTTSGDNPTGLKVLENPDQYPIAFFAAPGITFSSVVTEMIRLAEARQDCVAIIDTPDGLNATKATDWSNGNGLTHAITDPPASAVNSEYAAIYFPWIQRRDQFNRADVNIPPSPFVMAAAVRTFQDQGSWLPFAGLNRGKIGEGEVTYKVIQSEVDSLQDVGFVNPIVNFAGQGNMIFGNRTTARGSTVFTRLHVRNMINAIRKSLRTVGLQLLFDPNDPTTWKKLEQSVKQIVQPIIAGRGIELFDVTVSEETNPEAQRRQGILRGRIAIKPTDVAETIYFDLNVTENSATFSENPSTSE